MYTGLFRGDTGARAARGGWGVNRAAQTPAWAGRECSAGIFGYAAGATRSVNVIGPSLVRVTCM